MKKIIFFIFVIIITGFISKAWGESLPGKEIIGSETEVQVFNADEHVGFNLILEEMKVDCTIKVKTEEFTGTITFHDVSIFQCAKIKLINLFL